MLTLHHITKSYGIQPILQDISFSISNNERVGLIGPNGSGKTTLMRILAGIEQPDSGTVSSTRPNLRIGYLAQGMLFDEEQTIQSTLNLDSISQEDLEAEVASLASALVMTEKLLFGFAERFVRTDGVIPMRQNTMGFELDKCLLFTGNMIASFILFSIQISTTA